MSNIKTQLKYLKLAWIRENYEHELAEAAHVAEADVLDHRVLDLGVTVEERAQHLRTGLVEAGRDELAACSAREGRAGAVDENRVSKLGHSGGTS